MVKFVPKIAGFFWITVKTNDCALEIEPWYGSLSHRRRTTALKTQSLGQFNVLPRKTRAKIIIKPEWYGTKPTEAGSSIYLEVQTRSHCDGDDTALWRQRLILITHTRCQISDNPHFTYRPVIGVTTGSHLATATVWEKEFNTIQ